MKKVAVLSGGEKFAASSPNDDLRCISRERSEDTLQRLLEKVNRVPLHEDSTFELQTVNGLR